MRVCILKQDPAVFYRSYHYISNADLNTFINKNTGTLIDIHAIKFTTADSMMFSLETPAETIRANSDIVLLPCGNYLGLHTDVDEIKRITQKLNEINLPVVAVGLGAQSPSYDWSIDIAPEIIEFVKCIENHKLTADQPNIFTRGPYTHQQIELLGVHSSIPGVSPSMFINPLKQLGCVIRDNCFNQIPAAIAVTGSHYSRLINYDFEEQLLLLVNDCITPGAYIPQSPIEMVSLARNNYTDIDKNMFNDIKNSLMPHLSDIQFKQWCRQFIQPFFDVPVWLEYLRKFDLTIGSRYYGTALALQAGKLGVVIAIDSRTRELCEQTGVPFIWKDDLNFALTRRNLYDRFNDFNSDQYDMNRYTQACLYREFLNNNQINIAGSLYELLQ